MYTLAHIALIVFLRKKQVVNKVQLSLIAGSHQNLTAPFTA